MELDALLLAICADKDMKRFNSFPCHTLLSPHLFPLHLKVYKLQGGNRMKKLFLHRQIQSLLLQILIHWILGRVSTQSYGASGSPMQRTWPHCDPAVSSCLHITDFFFFPFHPSQTQGLKLKSLSKRDLAMPGIQTVIRACREPE